MGRKKKQGTRLNLKTEDVVAKFRKLKATGMKNIQIARELGISNAALYYHIGKSGEVTNQWTRRANAKSKKSATTVPTVHTFEVPEATDSTEGIAIVLKGTPQFLTETIRSINA